MKRTLLLIGLSILIFSQNVNAQRKGLIFDEKAYQKVPLADDEKLGYSDDLPSAVSYKQYAPHVGNQGDYGTCVGWSTAYGALTIEYAKKMGITDKEKITFSAFCPYYIYNQFKDDYDFFCQSGGLFEDALEIIYTKGAKRYYMPEYTCYSDYDNFSEANASTFKINDYYRLFDYAQSELSKALDLKSTRVENIKKGLAAGHPVLIGTFVPPSFDYLVGKDVWTTTQTEIDNYNTYPGHAMVIVGYDDNKYGGAFEIMNSWGTEWGNNGFIWAKYDDIDIFGHTAFYMDLGYKYYPSTGCQFGDCKNTYSKYKWDNGESYEGELKDGLFDGMGIYFWSNGDAYSGEWKAGLKHGKGIQKSAYGTTTSGYWKDNLYAGVTEPVWTVEKEEIVTTTETNEEETDINWEILYDLIDEKEEVDPTTGCVSGDCNNGFGKFIYSDGDIYEGYFSAGSRHGFGKYQYIEGDTYEGMWSWNNRTGLGYYKWPSGNEYIGYWNANQMDGLGTKYFTNGTNQAGQWKAGVFQTDDATFGFSKSIDEPVQGGHQSGTIFQRSQDGKPTDFEHKQIPMNQSGFNSIPKSKMGNAQEDPYYKMANTVLKTILTGIGKTDLTQPQLNIINSTRDVAYTNKKTGIHISTKFIDLCRSFGEDSLSALSVVMAHELGHYFKDHFFCRDFGYAYAETEWADSIKGKFKDIYQSGYFETQADEFGLFYSFVAGYQPFKVADAVIAKVYEQFDLPDEMTGYPPKDFRIEQIGLAEQNVQKLIPLFEVGNLMSVLASAKLGGIENDLLDNANLCYEHIIEQKVTTAEMYNNLGVNYVNKAIALIDKRVFPYALPLEIDFNSRLFSTTGAGTKDPSTEGSLGYGNNETEIIDYLKQAKAYFEKAIQLDETYIPGYNNLGATYFALKDYDEAWVKAKKARKMAKSANSAIQYRNSIDLLALISYYNDEQDDAIEYWEEALKLGSILAKHNIKVTKDENLTANVFKSVFKESNKNLATSSSEGLGGFQNPMTAKYERPDFRSIEKIKGTTLNDIAQEYLYNNKAIETWELKDNEAMVGKTKYDEGELIIFATLERGSLDRSYYFYFYPDKGTTPTSLQVTNGQNAEQVTSAYGEPVNIISSAKHNYWVYFNKNIIFKMNEQNVVDGYIIYDVNL